MRTDKPLFALILLIASGVALAEPVRRECLGRMIFTVPDEMKWAAHDQYTKSYLYKRHQGFSPSVTTPFDALLYDHDGLRIFVSDKVDKKRLEQLKNEEKGVHYIDASRLITFVETTRLALELAHKWKSSAKVIAALKGDLQKYEHELMLNQEYEHDLGFADTKAIGTLEFPTKAFLWRQQRIYTFSLQDPKPGAGERLKDLISRFEPRALYEIPTGPGVCLPYGFIRDDGNTHFEFKYSLRLKNNKNIIVGLINASAGNPWHRQPAFGTVNDYLPTYDFSRFVKRDLQGSLPLGDSPEAFVGWHVEPRPNSNEKERLWYAFSLRGGSSTPWVAVQVHTVRPGVDGIESVTPPPETIIPKIAELSGSISHK